MNGNARRLRRVIEKHEIIGLDTAPVIYYVEDVAPYADLLDPVFSLLVDALEVLVLADFHQT